MRFIQSTPLALVRYNHDAKPGYHRTSSLDSTSSLGVPPQPGALRLRSTVVYLPTFLRRKRPEGRSMRRAACCEEGGLRCK